MARAVAAREAAAMAMAGGRGERRGKMATIEAVSEGGGEGGNMRRGLRHKGGEGRGFESWARGAETPAPQARFEPEERILARPIEVVRG